MFSAINFGEALVLVSGYVMLPAGSSSASQLKMLPPACGARCALIFPIIVLSCFPRFVFTVSKLEPLYEHIEYFSIRCSGVLEGCSDAALSFYTRAAADRPCRRAEPRLIRGRQYSDF